MCKNVDDKLKTNAGADGEDDNPEDAKPGGWSMKYLVNNVGFSTEEKTKATNVLFFIIFGVCGFVFGTILDVLQYVQDAGQHEENKEDSDRDFTHKKETDKANLMIKEGEIARKVVDDLFGDNYLRKVIAIEIINTAAPTLGGKLLPLITISEKGDSQSGSSNDVPDDQAKDVSELANNALMVQRKRLSNELFDPIADNRDNAMFSITRGWNNDEQIIPIMLDTIKQYDGSKLWPVVKGKPNEWLFKIGAANTFRTLGSFPASELKKHKNEICSTAKKQTNGRPATQRAAEIVEKMIGDCT